MDKLSHNFFTTLAVLPLIVERFQLKTLHSLYQFILQIIYFVVIGTKVPKKQEFTLSSITLMQ
jgi:hypothetical protein